MNIEPTPLLGLSAFRRSPKKHSVILLLLAIGAWPGVGAAPAQSASTVVAWGSNESGQTTVPAAAQSGVMAVAAGSAHTVALKEDGTLVAWGSNGLGQVTGTPTSAAPFAATASVVTLGGHVLSGVAAIAAGKYHTVALMHDGTVVAWGDNRYGQVTGTPNFSDSRSGIANPVTLDGLRLDGVTAIAAGVAHTLALKSDGSVVAWGGLSGGLYSQGQAEVPVAAQGGITAIAAGPAHSVALKNDGTVVVWGANGYGQVTGTSTYQAHSPATANPVRLGDKILSGVRAIGAGGNCIQVCAGYTYALKDDGTVLVWGLAPETPAGMSGLTALAAGAFHIVALKSDGRLVAWGENGYGQVTGIPGGDAIADPVAPEGHILRGAKAIAAGDYHTVVLLASDNLPTFTKVTTGPLVTDSEGSAGFAWLDTDNDNLLDLYVSNLAANKTFDSFYQNKGDGTFVKVTNAITTRLSSSFVGVVGDYDNDGNEDLFVAHPSGRGNNLFRNEGAGQFTELTSAQAGPLVSDRNDSLDAAWADYDRDGFIDLFVANGSDQNDALYRNNGDGTFTKMMTTEVGAVVADRKHTGPCNWVDYDNDGYPDLWVGTGIYGRGTPVGTHSLYHNNGNGSFSSVKPGSMVLQIAGALAAWADYDNDGFPDLFMANYPGVNSLHHNLAGLSFTNLAQSAGLAEAMQSWSGAWGDYDNDGFQDLFVMNWERPNVLFHNNGDGTFTSVDVGSPIRDGFHDTYGGWVDYDNDGFLDIFVSNGFGEHDQNLLYRNNGNENRWLKVKLVGGASNRSGIGAKVRISTVSNQNLNSKPTWQMREISGNSASSGWQGLVAHFGVGQATIIDTVRIEWPSGIVQEMHGIAPKQFLTVVEPPLLQATSTNETFQLLITSRIGSSSRIESSSDLAVWTSLATVTNTTRTERVLDLDAANHRERFYRAVPK